MFVSFWGSSHWIWQFGVLYSDFIQETDLKIWSDCRIQHAYAVQHGTPSIYHLLSYTSHHPNQSQPVRNKDRKDNNNPYCIAGWRSFDEGRLYTNPTLKSKNGKKKLYPELRQHPLWTIGLLIFPIVFVLSISTWWSTSHITHVAKTWPSGREKKHYKWLKSPIWQFCWWPFWDGENKWPFQRWSWWPPTIGDNHRSRIESPQLKLRDPPTFAKTFLHFELGQLLSWGAGLKFKPLYWCGHLGHGDWLNGWATPQKSKIDTKNSPCYFSGMLIAKKSWNSFDSSKSLC